MRVSAKTNYAIRALLFIAAQYPQPLTAVAMAREGRPVRRRDRDQARATHNVHIRAMTCVAVSLIWRDHPALPA